MTKIKPRLMLECKHCGHRPPTDSVIEALLLHMQVEHDTDKVEMDLSAVCTCGATMTLSGSRPAGKKTEDLYRCDPCGNTGNIWRDKS